MLLHFIPFVSSVLKISYINKFVDAYNAQVAAADTTETAVVEETTETVAE